MTEITIQEVVDYWSEHEDKCGVDIDWDEAHKRCWRCCYKSKLERCHIIPKALNGTNGPSNFVLLCRRCHREAPNFEDSKLMWKWILTTGTTLPDTYWTMRGMEESIKIFGQKPFESLIDENLSKVSIEDLNRELKKSMQSSIIHFGEGRRNPSTIACILHDVEEKLKQTI